ncbi:hypothetical protein ES319_A05G161300v1 [Gossypium barbadense]|uniref:Uncharacterized protein n=2 Tax=Gossypium TaxID=3633 RepID=A0A5J5VQV5_GOSBA|nr:hypothetical protein ES319_A05G161300v1 [Gossypium barbadense]TYH17083.1 hypothetical protein ES288_A05G165200v1 [Gossypium darwinii]
MPWIFQTTISPHPPDFPQFTNHLPLYICIYTVIQIPDNRPSKELQRHPKTEAMKNQYHTPQLSSNQCGSSLVQTIDAPLPLVWSIIRRFDNPQAYKLFVKSCKLRSGNGGIGSVREVMVVSGLPAATSTERLDELDDECHVMMISIIGGDHRLVNYLSTTTLHEISEEGMNRGKTEVVESYVVDVPAGNSKEDTCCFANMIIGCNLRSLARITEKMAKFHL